VRFIACFHQHAELGSQFTPGHWADHSSVLVSYTEVYMLASWHSLLIIQNFQHCLCRYLFYFKVQSMHSGKRTKPLEILPLWPGIEPGSLQGQHSELAPHYTAGNCLYTVQLINTSFKTKSRKN
jgi:hypothetical protein